MARGSFVVQDNSHRAVGTEIVHVPLRLVGLRSRLGKEQQWIAQVATIGRVVHCPDEMSGGVDSKIDFHFDGGGRFRESHLVGRYRDG